MKFSALGRPVLAGATLIKPITYFTAPFVLGLACSFQVTAAVSSYTQDFEAMSVSDFSPDLSNDGWLVYGFAWGDDQRSSYLYEHGPHPAPNGGEGFSSVATGDNTNSGGETKYLNVYSDYANTGHGTGEWIDSFVYRESWIDAADIGSLVTFSFDAKRPDITPNGETAVGTSGVATAHAFVKTIDPFNGYSQTNYLSEDMTSISQNGWTNFSITLDLSDPLLEGQLLQFGFENFASNYANTGVYYDNLSVSASSIPVPAAAWLFGSGLLGLFAVRRQR